MHNCFGPPPSLWLPVSVLVCVSVRTAIKTCFSLDIFNVYFATAALNLIYVNSLKRQLAGCVCVCFCICICVCVSLSLYVCVWVCLWVCLCFTSFSFHRYFIIIKRISFTFMQLFLHLPHCFSPFSLSLLSLLLVVSYTIRKSERFFRRWMQLFSIYNALNAKWIRRNVKRVCVDRPANTLARCKESARYTYVTVLSRCHYYYD